MKSRLNVRLGARYAGLARGVGRWYSAVDATGTPYGYVWTDDKERFGIIDTSTGPRAEEALDLFHAGVDDWASRELSASAAFEESLRVQDDAYQIKTETLEGDLYTDLILGTTEKEIKTMPKSKLYSITVRSDGTVLEMLRSDMDGTYFRENGEWIPISPEASAEDYPTVYGQEWHDVKKAAVAYYDANADAGITKAEMEEFFLNVIY